ncbi:hypothetical protein [Nonlabens agnitus]|nr:hypothetical protein [Nonlabens agnitus]
MVDTLPHRVGIVLHWFYLVLIPITDWENDGDIPIDSKQCLNATRAL